MQPTLSFLAILHTVISFICIIGYNCLKIPLVIFKREKELARKLELMASTSLSSLRMMTLRASGTDWSSIHPLSQTTIGINLSSERVTAVDIKYQIWKFGVVFTDGTFLYLCWYLVMSLLGHYNNFFFACHLLDIAMGVKTLRTILSSLMMTVGLLAVVVYLYTVVAFNFFRKFYNKSEDEDEPDMKCDDMMTCYLFHMYVGVRAGGGIGDEIEDPAGDEYELYRTKCFICGIGSDYFDTTPHGFETHTFDEHNLANYIELLNRVPVEH
ncbi:hypothetical protein INR49_027853 [Caranx melampygus]|nr:hypothetical protein INR49_027853 [Caranx melampygus]